MFTTDQTTAPLFQFQGFWCVLGEPLWCCWFLTATAFQCAESSARSASRVALSPSFFSLILLSNLRLGKGYSIGLVLVNKPSADESPFPREVSFAYLRYFSEQVLWLLGGPQLSSILQVTIALLVLYYDSTRLQSEFLGHESHGPTFLIELSPVVLPPKVSVWGFHSVVRW